MNIFSGEFPYRQSNLSRATPGILIPGQHISWFSVLPNFVQYNPIHGDEYGLDVVLIGNGLKVNSIYRRI